MEEKGFNMVFFSNCKIYTSEKVITNKGVLIDDKEIVDIVDKESIPMGTKIIDCSGNLLAPGFIDMQINGGGGILFNNEISCHGLEKIRTTHLQFGVTNFLPTIITCPIEQVKKAITVVREYQGNDPNLLGLHIEGPFINKEKPGVHPKKYIIENPTRNIIIDLIEENTDVIKMITLAPEVINEDILEYLYKKGIVLSVGHSKATYDQVKNLLGNEIKCATHLFNAMSPLSSREPGVVGSVFSKKIYSGIIVDGHHVHYQTVSIAKELLQDKLFLITDAMPPVGTNQSMFQLGEDSVICDSGKCITQQGVLAGSNLSMDQAIKNCVQKVGISLDEAFRMASLYPAKLLKIDHKYGKIAKGYNANLVILNNELSVKQTVVDGEIYNYY